MLKRVGNISVHSIKQVANNGTGEIVFRLYN